MRDFSHVLLKNLDNPVRILSFSVTDLIAYLSPFLVGSLFDSLFVVPLIGIVVVFMLKRSLRKFPKFYGLRLLYWSLPTVYFQRLFQVRWPFSNKQFWVK
jgi:type IV conjugative transfer system protein TraL